VLKKSGAFWDCFSVLYISTFTFIYTTNQVYLPLKINATLLESSVATIHCRIFQVV
jgi:hypothetical protein